MSCASKIFFSISSSPCLHFAFISWGKVFSNQNTKVKPLKTNEFWNILIGLCSSVRYRNMGLNCPGCEIVSFCLCLLFLFLLIPLNTAYVQCTIFEKLSFQLSGIVFSDTHTHTLKKKKKKNKEKESFETYQIQCFVQGRRKNEPINFLLPVLTHLYYLFKNNWLHKIANLPLLSFHTEAELPE